MTDTGTVSDANRLFEIGSGTPERAREVFLQVGSNCPATARTALDVVARSQDRVRLEALVDAAHDLGVGTRNKVLYHAINSAVNDDRLLNRDSVVRLLDAVNEEARAWRCFTYLSEGDGNSLTTESDFALSTLHGTVKKNRKHSSVYAASLLLTATNVTASQAHDAAVLLRKRMSSAGALPRSMDDFISCAGGMERDSSRTLRFGSIQVPDMGGQKGGEFYRYPTGAERLGTAVERALDLVLRHDDQQRWWLRHSVTESVQAIADEFPVNWAVSWGLMQARGGDGSAGPWFQPSSHAACAELTLSTRSWPLLRSTTALKILDSLLESLAAAAESPPVKPSEPRRAGKRVVNGSGPTSMLGGLIAMIHPSAVSKETDSVRRLRDLTARAWFLLAPIAVHSERDASFFDHRHPQGGLAPDFPVRGPCAGALFSNLVTMVAETRNSWCQALRFHADEDRNGPRRVTFPHQLGYYNKPSDVWYESAMNRPEWAARNISWAIRRSGEDQNFLHPSARLSLHLDCDLSEDEILDVISVAEFSVLAHNITLANIVTDELRVHHTMWGRISRAMAAEGVHIDRASGVLSTLNDSSDGRDRISLRDALGVVELITG